jgi:hypothetical protein
MNSWNLESKIHTSYQRVFEALCDADEPALALQTWKKLLAYDEAYDINGFTDLLRADVFYQLWRKVRLGEISDPALVKEIDSIADAIGAKYFQITEKKQGLKMRMTF